MELDVVRLDAVLRGAGEGLRQRCMRHGIGFTPLGQIDFRLRSDTFLSLNGTNGAVAAQIARVAANLAGQPVGICTLQDAYLLAPNGIIIDRNRRAVWAGPLLGWEPENISAHSDFLSPVQNRPLCVSMDDALLDAAESLPEAVLWSGPAFTVFGHMLLDFLPRLEMILGHFPSRTAIYNPPLLGWAEDLVRMNFPAAPIHEGSMPPILRCGVLHVPTFLRRNNIVAESLVRPLWRNVGQRMAAASANTPGRGKYLFVSRRKWHKRSYLAGAAEIEAFLQGRGFTIIFPEEMSFAEQYAAFAGADVILGEDGSGLHNSIFSKPGTRIGVIWLGRPNLLHAMTANALGHHLLMIPIAEKASGIRRREADSVLPLANLSEAVDLLMSRRPIPPG